MLNIGKKLYMALGIAFCMAGSMAQPAQAGIISDLVDGAKDLVGSVTDDVKKAIGAIKNAGKTIINKAKYDAGKLKNWIDSKAPSVVSKAFDTAVGGLDKLTGAAAKVGKAILAHRDVIENAIVFGLQNGKTIADIGLDIAGLIPGVNVPAEAISIAVDTFLPTITTAVKTAVDADQTILMGK